MNTQEEKRMKENKTDMEMKEFVEAYPKMARMVAGITGTDVNELSEKSGNCSVTVYPTREDYVIMRMRNRTLSFISDWSYDFGAIPEKGMPSIDEIFGSITDEMLSAAAQRSIGNGCRHWMSMEFCGDICSCFTDGEAVAVIVGLEAAETLIGSDALFDALCSR